MTTGAELKQTGAELVIEADQQRENAGAHIKDAIETLAATGREFTAEDVREHLQDKPGVLEALAERPNLLPAYFTGAATRGDIRAVGFTAPTRASRHGSIIRVWKAAA